MKRRSVFLLVLLVVILLAAGIWARSNMYYETIEARVAPSAEVRRNEYLALERLLATQDIETDQTVSAGLSNVITDIEGEALWIEELYALKTEEQFEQLVSWVKRGGHLIGEITALPSDDTDRFYKAMNDEGIEVVLHHEEEYPEQFIEEISIPVANANGESIRLQLRHRQILRTNKNARAQIGDNLAGSRLLQVGVGDGFITLMPRNRMFENRNIDANDHAYFLLWLLNANPDLKTLTILKDLRDTPGLFRMLVSKFTLAFLALLAVIAAYLIRASTRLGPILQEPEPGGKNLISHLRARGFFLARQRKLGPMLLPIRSAAIQALSRRNGKRKLSIESADAVDSDTIKTAAKLAECSPEKAQKALTTDLNSATDLVDSSIVLHRILHPQKNMAASDHQTNTKGTTFQ